MSNQGLYKKRIFEYFKDNRFNQKLTDSPIQACAIGQICADQCQIYAKLEANCFAQLNFTVQGCILAVASANMLAEFLQHQPLTTLQNLDEQSYLEQVVQLPIDSARVECALLAFRLCKAQFFP